MSFPLIFSLQTPRVRNTLEHKYKVVRHLVYIGPVIPSLAVPRVHRQARMSTSPGHSRVDDVSWPTGRSTEQRDSDRKPTPKEASVTRDVVGSARSIRLSLTVKHTLCIRHNNNICIRTNSLNQNVT